MRPHYIKIVSVLIFSFMLETVSIVQLDVNMQRAEVIGGEEIVDSDVRVRKFNRTTHSLNGTWILQKDINDDYEVSMSFAYSSLGNNQWNEYPMKIPRKRVCSFMIQEYREYQYLWINSTNMPQVDKNAAAYCPYPTGTYWVKDVMLDASWIPPFIPTGLWRLTFALWMNGDTPVVQAQLFSTVSRKKCC